MKVLCPLNVNLVVGLPHCIFSIYKIWCEIALTCYEFHLSICQKEKQKKERERGEKKKKNQRNKTRYLNGCVYEYNADGQNDFYRPRSEGDVYLVASICPSIRPSLHFCWVQQKAITIKFGVKGGHYRSEGFVCLSLISGACADYLADAVDRLLICISLVKDLPETAIPSASDRFLSK